jgi:predicted transcriptional regulator
MEEINITKSQLKKCKPEYIYSLARYMKVKDIDTMSLNQLIKFFNWLFSRNTKRKNNKII